MIVPSNTYIATWLAVSGVGATRYRSSPIRHPQYRPPMRIEAALTPRCRAILPVHLYGQPPIWTRS